PARQLSDSFHFLRLIQLISRRIELLLRLTLLGDVARDLGKSQELPLRIMDGANDDIGPEGNSALSQPPTLGFVFALGHGRSQHECRKILLSILVGMQYGK